MSVADSTRENDITALRLNAGDAVEIRGQLVLRDGEIVVTGYRMLRPRPGITRVPAQHPPRVEDAAPAAGHHA